MSTVFYRDSNKNFRCKVKIEGTSYSKSKPRLVLEFADRTLMFNGNIKDGMVDILVPKLDEIDDSSGVATLEVIADSMFFEAWSGTFELKNKKTIQVTEVHVDDVGPPIIVEANLIEEEQTVKLPDQEPTQKKKPLKSIFTDACTDKNKSLAKRLCRGLKSLNESDTSNLKREISEFKPSNIVEKWASAVFVDIDTVYAKYCMMRIS